MRKEIWFKNYQRVDLSRGVIAGLGKCQGNLLCLAACFAYIWLSIKSLVETKLGVRVLYLAVKTSTVYDCSFFQSTNDLPRGLHSAAFHSPYASAKSLEKTSESSFSQEASDQNAQAECTAEHWENGFSATKSLVQLKIIKASSNTLTHQNSKEILWCLMNEA